MELLERESEGSNQTVSTQSSLINGLPDDIALTCLARIPRRYHSLLKCVSRTWRDLVCSKQWQSYREKHNLTETWIYALCKDKMEQLCCYVLDPNLPKKGWKRIPDLPPHCLKRKGVGFEVLGKNIYFLGGCGWIEDATDEVYSYDASRNAWTEASPLSTARYYFHSNLLVNISLSIKATHFYSGVILLVNQWMTKCMQLVDSGQNQATHIHGTHSIPTQTHGRLTWIPTLFPK